MYPNAAEMPPGQPQPVAYQAAPQPVAYQPAPVPVAAPVVPVQPISLGPTSVLCVCPSCHATVTTTTIYEAGGILGYSSRAGGVLHQRKDYIDVKSFSHIDSIFSAYVF